MAYCGQEGKDRIIFVTKEDHEPPSSAELVADDPNDPYEEHGLILPNGDINWNCPSLRELLVAAVGNNSCQPSPASTAARRISRDLTV
ncbi:Mitochondrial intermembrane space import and assembly protein 40 [Myotis davidii]|uniref:Mitochondrial intermembrane space import and assembly protein 40 n=1 Tax=Myotis davidii TaxID=225400 RepID=L5LGX2_MYODS|nr:Mitochondrial intermembrane space import and assembly protein 40 [Myotis davidii]